MIQKNIIKLIYSLRLENYCKDSYTVANFDQLKCYNTDFLILC